MQVRRYQVPYRASHSLFIGILGDTSMHTPSPTLNKAGKGMLSKLMKDTVDAKKTPAVFIGATTAGETLVLDCAGDLVCRKAGSGKVDLGTSES